MLPETGLSAQPTPLRGHTLIANWVRHRSGRSLAFSKLTVYPDRDHNSWDPAYGGANGDDIYSWMLDFTNP